MMGEKELLAETSLHWERENQSSLSAFKAVATELFTTQGQLEAERQRAAGSEEELHKALHREKVAERKLLAAQEELAALKEDQVPMFEVEISDSHWLNMGPIACADLSKLPDGINKLFTAAPKPVVSDSMALAFHQALNDGGIGHSDLEEIKVGLRAALGVYDGCVVKGGE